MADEVSNENLWFTDWSAGGAHPKVFRRDDIGRLTAAAYGQTGELPGGGTKLFARKFDAEVDVDVLDLIDHQLLARRDPDSNEVGRLSLLPGGAPLRPRGAACGPFPSTPPMVAALPPGEIGVHAIYRAPPGYR